MPGRNNGFLREIEAHRLRDLRGAIACRFLQEQEFGRFFPASICLFAFGIVSYFAIPFEPALWVLVGISALLAAGATLESRFGRGWPILLAVFCFAAGFTTAKIRTELVAAPKLLRPMSAEVTGRIAAVEWRQKDLRLTVSVERMTPVPEEGVPEKVRISVRGQGDKELKAGNRIVFSARLFPPSGAILPAGYDFSRRAYFRSIGATGFSFGVPDLIADEDPPGIFDRIVHSLQQFRHDLARHIVETVSSGAGGIAAALITGDRTFVSEKDTEALRDAGLSHVLAISGMHMALFAGTVFFAFRWMAAFLGGGLSYPIKSWAAIAALFSATGYLILSGASIPTQRAYIMTLIVLVGVIAGRPALTMRSVALAALFILVLMPESVLEPGFQMSFMAVAALIAVYESIRNSRTNKYGRVGVFGSVMRWKPVRFVGALLLTSLIASLATAPFAIFHFHRIAPLGLLANLAAMPIVSTIVMPSAVLSLLLLPFGLEAFPLWIMATGIEQMVEIAHKVQSVTGEAGHVSKFPPLSLFLITFGLLWLCVWQSAIRLAGLLFILPVVSLAGKEVPPDIIVSDQGTMIAARSTDGLMLVGTRRTQNFVAENWLSAHGISDSLAARRMTAEQRLCDRMACILFAHDKAGQRTIVLSQIKKPEAFGEDCGRVDVIITDLRAPGSCAERGAIVLDKAFWQTHGATYLTYRTNEKLSETSSIDALFHRRSAYKGPLRPWQPGYIANPE